MTNRVDDAKTCKRGGHFGLIEGVRLVFVEVTECAFKLFELNWSEIRHVARNNLQKLLVQKRHGEYAATNLIINEGELLHDTLYK